MGRAIRSTFYFGYPLAGYSNVYDRPEEQIAEIKEWVWTELVNGGLDIKNYDMEGLVMYFDAIGAQDYYITATLQVDAS